MTHSLTQPSAHLTGMRTHLAPAREFQPSAAQRRFVEYVVAHPEFKTVTQFCEAAAVPRSTYETWCRKPNFRTETTRAGAPAWEEQGPGPAIRPSGTRGGRAPAQSQPGPGAALGPAPSNAWHVMNLARANMVNSPVHFQALFQLLFSHAGQVSLSGWNERGALAPEDAWVLAEPEPAAVEPEPLPAANETAPAAGPAPTQRLRATPKQNQRLAADLRKKPPTLSAEVPPKTDPSPTAGTKAGLPAEALAKAEPPPPPSPSNIYRSLRNAILGVRDPA